MDSNKGSFPMASIRLKGRANIHKKSSISLLTSNIYINNTFLLKNIEEKAKSSSKTVKTQNFLKQKLLSGLVRIYQF